MPCDPELHRQLPLHPSDHLILLALVEESLHGYALLQHLESDAGGQVRLDPGNLYRRLRRLLDAGWIERLEEPPAGEDARRRLYRLRERGRAIALAETERLRRVIEGRAARSLFALATEARAEDC